MTRRIVSAATRLWLAVIALAAVVSDVVAQSSATTPVMFYKNVMPLLQKNGETCHRPGQARNGGAATRCEADSCWHRHRRQCALHAEREPVTDHVQIGFTLAKTPLQRRYLTLSTSSPSDRKQFAIPPMESNWEAPPAVVAFTRDVEVVGLMPHMHVRGKAARFYLDRPDQPHIL